MSSINWCEALQPYIKIHGRDALPMMDRWIESLPLKIVPADIDTAAQAAQLKTRYGLSLGDAFAAATTIQNNGVLVTLDDDFKILEGQVEIDWL
jgi:predicted nucleic acid-binding protein